MRLLAFVTDSQAIRRILTRIGEPTEAPVPKPARGPPDWDLEAEPVLDWQGQISRAGVRVRSADQLVGCEGTEVGLALCPRIVFLPAKPS